MSKCAVLLLIIALAASCILVPLPVHAGLRTIVVPDDFQTITTALNYAADGDTIFVRNGTYEFAEGQTLVISKSVSLIGEDTNNTILKLHPSLVQQGLDNGVFPLYGYEYPIEIQADNVTVTGFNITSEGGDITATGDMFQFTNNAVATRLNVYGCYENITKNNLTQGVVCYGSFNNIEGNQIAGWGIVISWSSSTMIHDNIITNCLGISIIDYNTSPVHGNRIFNNVVENCSIGLEVSLNGFSLNNTVYHNNFINNRQQTTQIPWSLDNGKEGNYWSDYAGNDTNNDGIGDTPYIIPASSRDNFPLMFPFDIENNKTVIPTTPEQESNSNLPSESIAVSVVVVAVVAVAVLVYWKKRKH